MEEKNIIDEKLVGQSVENKVSEKVVKAKIDYLGKVKSFFTFKKFGVLLILLFAILLSVLFSSFKVIEKGFASQYRLVPEKISKSAAIKISLPADFDMSQAQGKIRFEPAISGNWGEEGKKVGLFDTAFASEEDDKVVVFKPSDSLLINRYYNVYLTIEDGQTIKADFMAVDDPVINAVFPSGDQEAPEDSKVTVTFSRPIVALSTLDFLENTDFPIEIFPETKGKFRWISTNTLQFQPENGLNPSTNYTIKINEGFTSFDGVKIGGGEFKFKTRNLRYLHSEENDSRLAIYNEPIKIYFNQDVDIKKIAMEMILTKDGKDIPFHVSYAKKTQSEVQAAEKEQFGLDALGDFATSTIKSANIINIDMPDMGNGGKSTVDDSGDNQTNKSVLLVYNKTDKFGRENFWDFNSSYELKIRKAYPVMGDIIIDQERNISIQTTEIVKDVSVDSDRTRNSSSSLFDPQGNITYEFYEDVDISKSNISSSAPIDKIVYGEKCGDENDWNSDCQKVPDKKKVIITFDHDKVSVGSTIEIKLKEVYNSLGQKISAEERSDKFNTYNSLKISLGKDNYYSNTSSLILCSNNPLSVPEKKDFKSMIKAGIDYDIFSWGNSWIQHNYGDEAKNNCPVGLFVTFIDVGFMPEQNYNLDLDIDDVFGQKVQTSISFTTGKILNRDISIFPMQQSYSITSPKKTVISFGTENVEYINLEICKQGDIYGFYKQYQAYYSWDSNSLNFSNCAKLEQYEIQLTKKYWKVNYFDVDIKQYFDDPIGNYMIRISHPDYTGYSRHGGLISFLSVTNLAVGEKRVELSRENIGDNESLFGELNNIYWVTDINSQNPVEGVKVSMYSSGTDSREGVTNGEGVALIKPLPGLRVVTLEKGNDSTMVISDEENLNYASDVYSVKKSYIYTDRPIYRPGDNVNIKGVLRIGYDGNYQIGNRKVKVSINSPEWEKVFEQEVDINDFGTFLVSYPLDSDAPLGSYSICTNDYNCSYFNVLEYVPAAFEVKASTEKDDYSSKDDVKINVDANYYFGVPVDNAEVEYTVSSQNYYFDRSDDWSYNFGYNDEDYYYSDDYYYGDKFLFRGKTTLNAEGKGVINENIDLAKLFKDSKSSKIIVFDINVKNSFGQNVSYQKSVILHAGSFYLGSAVDQYYVAKNQDFNLKIKSLDVFGKNKKVNDINVDISKTRWEYSKRQNSEGGYDYKWEKKSDLVKSFKASTDDNGDYSINQKLENEGSYEIQISSADERGNKVYSNSFIYVYGDRQVSVRYNDDTELELKSIKTDLKEGETGELIIESPFPKAKALITIERGRVFEYKVVDIVGSLYDFKFKAERKYAPNVYVSVLLQSSDPQVKFGTKEFSIDTLANKLNIDVTTDKQSYAPGDEVNLKVNTKDSESKGVKAEVSLSVVDASVLALTGNPKKDPLSFFYDGFPLTVSTSSNIRSVLIKREVVDTKGGSGGGSEDSGKSAPRGEFRDTAFWKGDLVTDDNGYAEIKFKLPDNLTRWQIEALGVTPDTKLGVSYSEFITRKELMVVPLKPRFIIPGDTFSVGATIFNQSDERKDIKVSFSSDTLNFLGESKEMSISLEKGKSQSVYFSVKAPADISSGTHSFIISADGGDKNDAVEQKIVIRQNQTYETVATSNYVTEDIVRESVYIPANVVTDRGEVSVRASATLAVFLSSSMNYLIQYPYGCSEQLSSILKGLATVEQALKVPNVADTLKLDRVRYDGNDYNIQQLTDIGMKKLFKNQNSDGGFSLWGGDESSYYVSLKVLDALVELNRAGKIKDDDPRFNNLINYIYNNFSDKYSTKNSDSVINAGFNILLVGGDRDDKAVKSALEDILSNEGVLKDELSNQSLAKLSILANRGEFTSEVSNKLNALLDNRLNIDARGAFIEPRSENVFWYNYETSIGDTSLYLRSIVAGERNMNNTDNMIRWMLNSRSRDGSWGSTQNNIAVIEAFVDFLNWKKETEANYNLDVKLNGEKIDSFSFTPKNIFDQFNTKLGMNRFKVNSYNNIEFNKKSNRLAKDSLYYDMSFKYYLTGDVDSRDEGFTITRAFYSLDDKKNTTPLASASVGNVVREHLEIVVPKTRNFVFIEDYIPAGMEIVDMDLATEQQSLRFAESEVKNNTLYPDFKELRDDRAVLYADMLYPGIYEFDYFVRPLIKGNYYHLPAVVSEMYTPENFGRTRSSSFEIR
ncbi:MAG: alpha-2-macroglobulin family protein [Candidatus Pacebacteria bacterium]|nr:alpha-2-macroglobulin family protein [Candidatus Paceibacterota bacterium]